EAGTINYAYDDGPGAFSGAAATRFLDWVIGLVRWPAVRHEATATASSAASTPASVSAMGSVPPTMAPAAPTPSTTPPLSAPLVPVASPISVTMADSEVWARPQDLPGAR